jgi:TRAP-type mannitol/chloroaromatic compound transport system permease small subunit
MEDGLMGAFVRLVDALSEWTGKLASLLMIPLVLITCFEVFMRYIVAKPTIWAWDLNIQIFAAIVMLGGAEALRKGAHIVVDVVVDKAKPRTRALLDLLTSPIFFFGMLVLLLGGWDQFYLSWRLGEAMPTVWAPPYYTMKFMVPLGTFLLMLQGVAECWKKLEVVRGRRKEA